MLKGNYLNTINTCGGLSKQQSSKESIDQPKCTHQPASVFWTASRMKSGRTWCARRVRRVPS